MERCSYLAERRDNKSDMQRCRGIKAAMRDKIAIDDRVEQMIIDAVIHVGILVVVAPSR